MSDIERIRGRVARDYGGGTNRRPLKARDDDIRTSSPGSMSWRPSVTLPSRERRGSGQWLGRWERCERPQIAMTDTSPWLDRNYPACGECAPCLRNALPPGDLET